MAFAAVLTALGYYIILRRFCQGLLKIFFAGRSYGGGSFPPLPPATPVFGLLPCPSPAGDGSGRASKQRRSKPPRQRVIRHPCSGAARVQVARMQGAQPLA